VYQTHCVLTEPGPTSTVAFCLALLCAAVGCRETHGSDAATDAGPRVSERLDATIDAREPDAAAHADDAAVPAQPADAAAVMPDCKHEPSYLDREFSGTHVSLEALCKQFRCPTDLQQALSWNDAASCYGDSLESGCGTTTVRNSWQVFHFDSATGRLTGAGFGSDVYFSFAVEGCSDAYFQAGEPQIHRVKVPKR
jgi:hypothetical protein